MDSWTWDEFIAFPTESSQCASAGNDPAYVVDSYIGQLLDNFLSNAQVKSTCLGEKTPSAIVDTHDFRVQHKIEGSPPVPSLDSVPPLVGVSATGGNRPKRKADDIALEDSKPVSLKQVKQNDACGLFMVHGRVNQPRGPYEEDRRMEVAFNRKIGACKRCKRLKAPCGRSTNPYEMCRGCTSLKNPLSLKLPCFLETLTEAQLFRNKASMNHPLYIARPSVYELRDSAFIPADMHTVYLSQGTGQEVPVNIARFFPQPGDKTAYVWTTSLGTQVRVDMPPLCIVQLEEAKAQILAYIERSRNAYICNLPADTLTSMVLDEALRFAVFNPNSTTSKALDLLAADRIIERDWIISRDSTCDIDYVSDPDNPNYTKRPITPTMDCQLDQIVIQGFLQPLRKELLEQLQTNINTNRHERWYDIFLTTFVLLVNAEQLLAHSRRNAQRHGAQGRYNSPELATLYCHACKMFIAHFRFVCNFRGLISIDWRSREASAMAKLDREQLGFLNQIKNKVQNNRQTMLNLRRDYEFERPSYWTHQIMFDGWNAGDPVQEQHHIYTAPVACA